MEGPLKRILILPLMMIAQPALANESGSDAGARVEVRLGWEAIDVRSRGPSVRFADSVSIGAELGYDIPIGEKLTFGPYANYEYARSKRDLPPDGSVGSDGTFQLGARFGVQLGAGSQLYVKGGYEHLRWRAKAVGGGPTLIGNTDGWVAAAGFDQRIASKVYVGIEAGYANLGQVTGAELVRPHAALKLGMRF